MACCGASKMMFLLMVVTAETEVTFDNEQDVVCAETAVVASSVDNSNLQSAFHHSETPATLTQSAVDDRNDRHSMTAWLVV